MKKIDELLKKYDVQAMNNDNFRKELLDLFLVSKRDLGNKLAEVIQESSINMKKIDRNSKEFYFEMGRKDTAEQVLISHT